MGDVKISELAYDLYVRAVQRRKEYAPTSTEDNLRLAFSWDITNEGDEYWRNINDNPNIFCICIKPKKPTIVNDYLIF